MSSFNHEIHVIYNKSSFSSLVSLMNAQFFVSLQVFKIRADDVSLVILCFVSLITVSRLEVWIHLTNKRGIKEANEADEVSQSDFLSFCLN